MSVLDILIHSRTQSGLTRPRLVRNYFLFECRRYLVPVWSVECKWGGGPRRTPVEFVDVVGKVFGDMVSLFVWRGLRQMERGKDAIEDRKICASFPG